MSHRGIFSKPHLSLIKTTRRDLCVPREFDHSISHTHARTHTHTHTHTHTYTQTRAHTHTQTHQPVEVNVFFSVDVYFYAGKMEKCAFVRLNVMMIGDMTHSWRWFNAVIHGSHNDDDDDVYTVNGCLSKLLLRERLCDWIFSHLLLWERLRDWYLS